MITGDPISAAVSAMTCTVSRLWILKAGTAEPPCCAGSAGKAVAEER